MDDAGLLRIMVALCIAQEHTRWKERDKVVTALSFPR